MKRAQPSKSREDSRELIGEMMLAKSVLEEKSELLDQKEKVILQLRSWNRQLEEELEEMRAELEHCAQELERSREAARREGILGVVEQVVCLAADYEAQEPGADRRLAGRLIRLFQERYGLEVLNSAPGGIDPQIHQVIVAEHGLQDGCSIQVLRKGFRLDGKVIRPVLVKVVEGKAPERSHSRVEAEDLEAGKNPGL